MNGEGTTRDGTHSSEHVQTHAIATEHHRPAVNMHCARITRNICLPYRIRLDVPRYKGGLIEISPYNAWFTRGGRALHEDALREDRAQHVHCGTSRVT